MNVYLDCRMGKAHQMLATIDTLAEWSKAVDSSSTIFGCVGSNPTGVIAVIHVTLEESATKNGMAMSIIQENHATYSIPKIGRVSSLLWKVAHKASKPPTDGDQRIAMHALWYCNHGNDTR